MIKRTVQLIAALIGSLTLTALWRWWQIRRNRSTADKAVPCFGALCQESQEILMDFAQGYPNSEQMW